MKRDKPSRHDIHNQEILREESKDLQSELQKLISRKGLIDTLIESYKQDDR